jgi:hypothetical protein
MRAILGKTIEELGELTAALARAQIQGVDEVHPVTGKSNRVWIEEEIQDVLNMIDFCPRANRTSEDRIASRQRRQRKFQHIDQWLRTIRNLP